MKDSSLPGGEAGEDSLRASQRVKPGESWGAMAPAERERILQALRDNFPARYRQLVEQYYEQLAKKP
jgi:acyl-CoA reductase-like NAD-dependent aldehyde dehydrogenase